MNALESGIENKISKRIQIKKIKKNAKKWLLECNDRTRTYGTLISTVHLKDLIKLIEDVPKPVKNAIDNLNYTSLVEVMIGLDKPLKHNISWLYVPSYSDARCNRVSFPSYFSPNMTPKGCSSMLVESTCIEGDEVWRKNDKVLIDETVRDLKKIGLIDKQKVVFSKVNHSIYAYVVYDLDYTKKMEIIYKYFNELGIELCGRFSEFKYYNMDATMSSALRMADKLNGKVR